MININNKSLKPYINGNEINEAYVGNALIYENFKLKDSYSLWELTKNPNILDKYDKDVLTITDSEISYSNGAWANIPNENTNIGVISSEIRNGLNKNPYINVLNIPNCETIGYKAFSDLDNIVDIVLPKVTTIPSMCFNGSKSLTNIHMDNILNIEATAFYFNTNVKKVDFPNCITMDQLVFFGCTNLEEVNLPKVKSITHQCFNDCPKLKSLRFESAEIIEQTAFWENEYIESLEFDNCYSIDYSAFEDCASLKTLKLTNGFAKPSSFGLNIFKNTNTENIDLILGGSFTLGSISDKTWKIGDEIWTFKSIVKI